MYREAQYEEPLFFFDEPLISIDFEENSCVSGNLDLMLDAPLQFAIFIAILRFLKIITISLLFFVRLLSGIFLSCEPLGYDYIK